MRNIKRRPLLVLVAVLVKLLSGFWLKLIGFSICRAQIDGLHWAPWHCHAAQIQVQRSRQLAPREIRVAALLGQIRYPVPSLDAVSLFADCYVFI